MSRGTTGNVAQASMKAARLVAEEAAFNSNRADAYSLNENLQFQFGFLAGVSWAEERPNHYREAYSRAVASAIPHLQSGGRYAHLLRLGDDIIVDGIPALCREIDRLRGLTPKEAP